jgi:hypothetical protein
LNGKKKRQASAHRKRPKGATSLPLENFFESLTTAIRHLRYSPGINSSGPARVFFILYLYIPLLMAVVGLTGTARAFTWKNGRINRQELEKTSRSICERAGDEWENCRHASSF